VSNWIDDGHGNKWHRCKLGPDCGLKVIEAGRAKCWCQDQEASREKVQSAREEIATLESDNERLRKESKAAKIDRDAAGWDDYAVIAELKRENAALRTVAMKLIVNNGGPLQSEEQAERDSVDDYIMIKLQDFEALCAAIDTARKEAKQ
jgi:hypothetical protein